MITLPSRYEILPKKPVKGGFSSTVICKDHFLERKVVIKTIDHPKNIKRLLDEIKALQLAKSKNVVQIYDVIYSDKDETEVAIVEEYLPGKDLLSYKATNEDLDNYYMILYQLSQGLMDIHSCDIVHRDFKPNNVKYGDENILKIFDFGLAKCETLPASTLGIIGTPGFMALELYQNPPVIDKPVDSYAFGASAFYFAKGSPLKPPFPMTASKKENLSNYLNIDSNIGNLIDRCINDNPIERPKLSEINTALKRLLLYGRYKATLTTSSNVYILNEVGKGIRLSRISDKVVIIYDGFDFVIDSIEGDVYVNDNIVNKGFKFNGASVVTLGAKHLGSKRTFVTFDVSHPEVVL